MLYIAPKGQNTLARGTTPGVGSPPNHKHHSPCRGIIFYRCPSGSGIVKYWAFHLPHALRGATLSLPFGQFASCKHNVETRGNTLRIDTSTNKSIRPEGAKYGSQGYLPRKKRRPPFMLYIALKGQNTLARGTAPGLGKSSVHAIPPCRGKIFLSLPYRQRGWHGTDYLPPHALRGATLSLPFGQFAPKGHNMAARGTTPGKKATSVHVVHRPELAQ